jgi:hypothetical protein
MARAPRNSIAAVWDEALEPDVRQYQVAVARQVLAEEQLRGFDERPVRIVDRRTNAPVESVRAFGVIEFVSRADLADVARWVFAELVRRSPVGPTGRYQKSHLVFLNRASVGDMEAALRVYKPGDRIQIVNTQPYARKIEGRKQSKAKGGAIKPLSKQAPNGVYRAVYAAARRRFAQRGIFFDFTYRKLDLGVTAWGLQGGGRNRKRIRRPIVYPQIQIYQSTAGREGSS